MDAEAALIGRMIAGRYRIERCIGRGGMAAVFAARQDAEPREVAVKIMKRELMKDSTVVKRFRREAKAAAMLHHPNTVKVLDYGVDGEDAYIAMELASGKDLFQALAEERPMTQTRAALIVSQVGAALSAAHAQGIVHRDLKPENVMLVPSDEVPGGELVKVLDFGIAKILEPPSEPKAPGDPAPPQRSETSTNLTRVGTVVGTPAYMSPEQCRGGELDGRSDVYSSGVLLYQLLTGQLPFMGETPLHTAMRHIHAPPRPPSEIRADLHKGLERIVLKALAKWPGERQQSAEELREELLAVIDGLPDRDRVLGAKTSRTEPGREPGEEVAGARRGAMPPTTREGSPARPNPRPPSEAPLGMRLGGSLGKLVQPTTTAKQSSRPPPPRADREDTDDELERRETPALVVGRPPPSPRRAAAGGAPRAKWGDDDDERTRLRPVTAGGADATAAVVALGLGPVARRAPPPPDEDDDDGPRTALMAPESVPRRARPNKTLLMEDEPGAVPTAPRPTVRSGESEVTETRPNAATGGQAARPHGGLASEPDIRSTVRLGSPPPVATPSPSRKDITPAAFARTQNATEAEVAAALAVEDARAGAAKTPGADFLTVSATVRRLIVDEASGSDGPLPEAALGPGMIAPPLAPPLPRPLGSSPGSAALTVPQPSREPIRGSLEQLPGATVLVVGVALGVVFSAVVILVIIFVARG